MLVIRVVVAALLIFVAGAFLWAVTMDRDIHPEDKAKPVYLQRVRSGSPYGPKSWAPRWHGWLGIAATLLLLPLAALFFMIVDP
jgi:hypothetical protein